MVHGICHITIKCINSDNIGKVSSSLQNVQEWNVLDILGTFHHGKKTNTVIWVCLLDRILLVRLQFKSTKMKLQMSFGTLWMGEKSLSETFEGLHSRTDSTPVTRLAVLSLLQEILATVVVGVLIEHPPAIKHFAGVHLPPTKLLQKGRTVLCSFEHLTPKVGLLIQLHLVRRPTGLKDGRKQRLT